jgi:hypothetical protein
MRLPSLLLVCAAATQLGNTDCGQVLRDSGFDLWCGDHMCAWNVERGQVQRVPTWNEGDPGVELVGDDVAISQLSPVASTDGHCLEFDLIANIGAQTIQGGCSGLTPIVPAPASVGAYCDTSQPQGCASGICEVVSDPGTWFGVTGACAGCDDTHGCGSGEVCGLHEATSPVFEASHGCIAAGSKQLGERCDGAAECASDLCTAGVCSSCDPTMGCGCGLSWTGGPSVCEAGSHQVVSGQPCGTDADCASGSCQGAPRGECEGDGRPCATAADCEFGAGSNGPLANGACTIVGVQGGTCR